MFFGYSRIKDICTYIFLHKKIRKNGAVKKFVMRPQWEEAARWYDRRRQAGGWPEEEWCAAYHYANCLHNSGHSWPEVMEAYLVAYEMRPSRLEPLLPLCRALRQMGRFHTIYALARPVLSAPYPKDILFIEKAVYAYDLLMEYAIACYWVGQHQEAVRLNEQLLAMSDLPENYRLSAARNRDLSLAMLANA